MLYAVQTSYDGQTLLLTAADSPIEALDAYSKTQGMGAYSSLDEEGREEYLYEYPAGENGAPAGLLGAVHQNFEIVAVPVTLPLRFGIEKAGVHVADAAGLWILDGYDTEEEAAAVVKAADPSIVVQS